MGKGKGQYNKDCQRSRQEKQQMKGKYGSITAMRLREKLTGKNRNEGMKADCDNVLKNPCNACYSGFAKRALRKKYQLD